MIDVVIVDDHAIVRHGLEQLLETTDDLRTVGTATDGAEAVTLVTERRPDIVLMDLSMPDMDGIEATRQILEIHPDVAIVVLTSFGDQRKVLDALDAGAVGFDRGAGILALAVTAHPDFDDTPLFDENGDGETGVVHGVSPSRVERIHRSRVRGGVHLAVFFG